MPRPSLRRTLIVTFALVCTLPILILAAWFTPHLRQHTLQMALDRSQATAQNLATPVHAYLAGAREALHAASVFAAHDDDEVQVAELMTRQRYFRTVLLLDAQGVIKRWPATNDTAPTQLDDTLRAAVAHSLSRDEPSWSGVVRSPYDGRPTVLFIEPTAKGRVVGLLNMAPLLVLAQRVHNGPHGYAAITDQTGHVVASADPAWVQQIASLSAWPVTGRAQRGETGAMVFEPTPGSARYLAGFAPVPEFHWAVLTPQPAEDLQAESDALLRTVAWVGLGSLSLGLILAVGLSCWIARPIASLARVVQGLPSNGYRDDFEVLAKIAPCELDTLQRRSRQMAKEVRQAIRQRDRMNDELAHLVERATRGLQDANTQLSQQALVDDLTHLHNRRALWQRISDLERTQPDTYLPVQVLLFDLDNFKEVNDRYGHLAGDQVLIHVAAILERETREGDFVVRYGGDEFLVVMPHCTPAIAGERADAMCRAVAAQAMVIENHALTIHMSVGIAESESKLSRPSFDELLKAADRAMYAAKARNKQRDHRARA